MSHDLSAWVICDVYTTIANRQNRRGARPDRQRLRRNVPAVARAANRQD
jgi:hypothetical protein